MIIFDQCPVAHVEYPIICSIYLSSELVHEAANVFAVEGGSTVTCIHGITGFDGFQSIFVYRIYANIESGIALNHRTDKVGHFYSRCGRSLIGRESSGGNVVLIGHTVTSESGNTPAFEMILYLASGFDRLGILLHNYIGRCDSRCRKR